VLLALAAVIAANPAVWDTARTWIAHVTDREWLQAHLRALGWAAPAAFMGLQVAQVVAAPIPGEATGIIGGYVFGTGLGFLYSSVALTIGSLVNFAIGRLLGEKVVRRLVPAAAWNRFNHLVAHRGTVAVLVMFIIPGFPKDYLCLLLGLTTMPLKLFALMSGLGRMPGTLMLSLQGAALSERNYLLTALLVAVCALAVWAAYRWREPLHLWMGKMNAPPDPRPARKHDERPPP
jgi:uncharacterized membrane protein YdjX (TVP38/TMEM64 family)